MIGEKLQRDRVQDRRQDSGVVGYADHMQAVTAGEPGVLIRHHVQLAAARSHFLQIGPEFLKQCVLGRDRDDRHALVDQREWPVLEFTRRIGLGMDVGDLLQLERSLHRDRIMDAAAQEQRVMVLREFPAPGADQRLGLQDLRELRWHAPQRLQQCRFPLARQPAARLGERHREQHERGELGGEGFGRGDADFGTGPRQESKLRGAQQSRFRNVADRQTVAMAERPGVMQRRERVGGLA